MASRAAENAMAVACGAVFGIALDKAKTNVPFVVSGQLQMGNFTMMRMFLAGSASSVLAVLALDLLGIKRCKPRPAISVGGWFGSYGGNVLGGALLGMGMFLTGSCPGTVWAQLGAGLPNVGAVVAGGLTGTLIFGYLEKVLRERNPAFQSLTEVPQPSRPLGRAAASLAMAGAMAGAIVACDVLFPWRAELGAVLAAPESAAHGSFPDLSAVAWDPAVCGLLLGLLQFPVQLSRAMALGQSSGWAVAAGFAADAVDPDLKTHAPYLKRSQSSAEGSFQLFMAVGVACGAYLSQTLSGQPALSAAAVAGQPSFSAAFVGGALLLFGARLGDGCTSGHGLSGVAELSAGSLVSVAAMFAGGMALAALSSPPKT